MTFGYYQTARNPSAPPKAAGMPTASGGRPTLAHVLAGLSSGGTPGRSPATGQPGSGPAPAGQSSSASATAPGAAPAAAGRGSTATGAPPTSGPTLAQVLASLQRAAPPAPGGSGSGGGGGGGTGGGGPPAQQANTAAVLKVTAAFTALAAATTILVRRFGSMVDNTLALNGQLDEFSGEIAAANARAEAAGIRRSIRQAEAIGGGFSRLSEARSENRDLITGMMAPFQNLAMNISATILNGVNLLLRAVEPAVATFGRLADLISNWLGAGNQNDITAGRAFLSDVSDGRFDGIGTQYMNPGNQPLMAPADRLRVFGP